MGFLHWYDWIQPTNPYAALFFGCLLTLIVAIVVWFDTKSGKTTSIVCGTGLCVTIVGVALLYVLGFYG
ncbi:hypothetical protein [Salirhabdus sp. Marseille-P4669]|uniref:hypothetical protein n=1 Tax=Salirhabdus sp. Marseille-P4669 TaxID=2042310 RepID=UPI000C7B7428|nr:hypothetical protein [Salirhabdus sp. Marseille-P4669]